jgi:hypothetical protein
MYSNIKCIQVIKDNYRMHKASKAFSLRHKRKKDLLNKQYSFIVVSFRSICKTNIGSTIKYKEIHHTLILMIIYGFKLTNQKVGKSKKM